jgi:hypothetical protein
VWQDLDLDQWAVPWQQQLLHLLLLRLRLRDQRGLLQASLLQQAAVAARLAAAVGSSSSSSNSSSLLIH